MICLVGCTKADNVLQGMEGSCEPVSQTACHVGRNPQASPLYGQGPRLTQSNLIPQPSTGASAAPEECLLGSLYQDSHRDAGHGGLQRASVSL